MQRWKPFKQEVRCEVEIVLKANYVQVNNEESAGVNMDEEVRKEFEDFWEHYKSDPFAGRNEILASLCPQVFGMYLVKLAVAMVLAGGIQRTDATGTRVRGESLFYWLGILAQGNLNSSNMQQRLHQDLCSPQELDLLAQVSR